MTDESSGSVSGWIGQLRDGDPDAARLIWKRYGATLVHLARSRLGTTRRRVTDEEDVALTAFEQFCHGVEHQRFQKLENREDLWQILVMLVTRRSRDQVRREARRAERGESVFTSAEAAPGMGQISGREAMPQVVVQAMDQCNALLDCLDDPLQRIACRRLEGFTVEEIATEIGCVPRTVERKLAQIRQKWEAHMET